MASIAEIYNEALGLLGAQKISDPSGTGVAAVLTSVYATCRQALLESHPWNFALKRSLLALSTDEPIFEFDYKYTLPVDCLRIVKLYNTEAKWVEIAGSIETNDDEVSCLYIGDTTDPNIMSPLFRRVLAMDIALAIGYTLTQNEKLLIILESKRKEYFSKAKMVDAQKSGDFGSSLRSNIELAVETPYGLLDE